MLTNPPVPCDFRVCVPISHLLVGAFSVIVQLHRLIVYSTTREQRQQPAATIHYVYLIKSDLQLAGLGGAGRYATGQAFIQTVSSLASPVTSFVL